MPDPEATQPGVSAATMGYPAPAPAPAAHHEGLSHLKKMSTTAGIGSGEYVAVNPIAVAAVILGFCSVFVPIFGSSILLLIPLGAIVAAVVSWRQVGDSNGTQTGKMLAVVGIVVAVLIGGGTVASQVVSHLKTRADEKRIKDVIATFGNYAAAHNGKAAYELFGEPFKQRFGEDRVAEVIDSLSHTREAGAVLDMTSNGRIEFDPDSTKPQAVAMGLLRFEKSSEPYRVGMRLKKSGERWLIEEMPTLFPLESAKPQAAGGGGIATPYAPAGPPVPAGP